MNRYKMRTYIKNIKYKTQQNRPLVCLDPVVGFGIVTICTIGIVVVSADDALGFGVADNFLFAPLEAGINSGLIMIFD